MYTYDSKRSLLYMYIIICDDKERSLRRLQEIRGISCSRYNRERRGERERERKGGTNRHTEKTMTKRNYDVAINFYESRNHHRRSLFSFISRCCKISLAVGASFSHHPRSTFSLSIFSSYYSESKRVFVRR